MLKKLENTLLNVQKVFFTIVMAFMVIVLSAHVFMRFLINSPIIWSDEVITMTQGVIAFLGIGYCFHRGKHTELTLLYERVPRPVQWVFDIITNTVMLVCVAFMIRTSIEYTIFKHIPMGTIPWMKQSYIYCLIVVGFVIAEGYILVRLCKVFADIVQTIKARGAGKE